MIIQRVWSENVLKYATLELQHLPAQGLIGISGQNESGKSSIGEIICFALFGRTFSYGEHDHVHVIRWGEPRCAVSVEFSIHDHRYTVARFLDAQGNHGVRLNDHNDQPLARGVEPVREALETILGFGFDEFIESFYLAQREITTPHPHSAAVKKIAGIAALEQVATQAKAEIRQQASAIDEAQQALTEDAQRLAELNLDASLLPTLEHQRQDLQHQQAQEALQDTALQTTIERYQDSGAKIRAAGERFSGAGVDTTSQGWQAHVEHFEAALAAAGPQEAMNATLTSQLDACRDFARKARQHLSGIDRLYERARRYHQHLATLLGAGLGAQEHTQQSVEPLGTTQRRLQEQRNAIMESRAKSRVGRSIFLLLAAVVWAVWGLLTQGADSSLGQAISTWLANMANGGAHTYTAWLLLVAGLLSGLCVLYGLRTWQLGAKITQLQESVDDIGKRLLEARRQTETLASLESVPLPQAVSILAGFQDSEVAAGVREFRRSASAAWIDTIQLQTYYAELDNLKDRYEASVLEQCQTVLAQRKNLQEAMARRQEHIAQLHQDIAQEQHRHQRGQALQAAVDHHQRQITACTQRIQVRELACNLLEEGAQYLAKTFNRDVRSLVSRTLPLLTQGRYQHLKIDEHLDVQVFSNEKRDFMQLEEISSGTQRQIMFAVRLALSQQFVNTTLGCRQFIFLDEPFAFFDEERTRSALQALPELSAELSQIWIVAQSFPQDFAFALHIHCRQDQQVLSLSGG